MNKNKIIALGLTMTLGLGGVQIAYASQYKEIDLVVDEETTTHKVKGNTVKEVLDNIEDFTLEKGDELISHDLEDETEKKDVIKVNTEKTFKVNGKDVKTNANTFREYLNEIGEDYDVKDHLNYNVDDKLVDGLDLIYAPYREEYITEKEEIPFEEETIYDFNMNVGEEEVIEGENGIKEYITKAKMEKGEISVGDKQERIIKKPKNKIIKLGSRYEQKEEIAYQTNTEYDNSMYQDQQQVITEGSVGIKNVVYEKKGEDYTKISETIEKDPVTQIVKVGTKERPRQTYQQPAQQQASSGSGNWAKEWIAQRESGGSYTAHNPRGGYYGRYQLNPSLIQYGASPAEQEAAADNYVAQRYGSWENAQAFWARNGWY